MKEDSLSLQESEKEQVIFRATQITGDFPMKRFTQQAPDFPVSHLAGEMCVKILELLPLIAL